MNKTVTIDLTHAAPADVTADAARTAGRDARRRASAVAARPAARRGTRRACSPFTAFSARKLPPTRLAIYEAGGGSTSFLPLDVLRRAHVTVVDIDEDQIRNNDYAQETILGDVQTYRFPPGSFDLVICYNVIEHLADVEAALLALLRIAETRRPDPDRRAEPEIAFRRRHQILAALVPCLVLPLCARRQDRPASPASRRSRPSSTRWSRFRISKPSPSAHGLRDDLPEGI